MPEDLTPEQLKALDHWKRQRTVPVQTRLSESVRPIFFEDKSGAPHLIGSGVLMQFGDQRFLFTAAHVLDCTEQETLYLGGDTEFVPLSGKAFKSTAPNGRRKDKIDVGILHLRDDIAEQLDQKCRYLTKADVDPNDAADGAAFYMALGYPLRKSKNDFSLLKNKHAFLAIINPPAQNACVELGGDPATHVAVEFNRLRMRQGTRVQATVKPEGMSGGGLWRFETLTSTAPTAQNKLVGILIEYHDRKRKMLASRIGLFLETLRAEFPHLDQEIPRCRIARINSVMKS